MGKGAYQLTTTNPLYIYNRACDICPLRAKCAGPVPGEGPIDADIMFVGEAPGCISSDSLIDVAFRDKSVYPDGIPIKDLVGQTPLVYSFDVGSQELVIGQATKVWRTGRKPVYRVTYQWGYAKGNRKITLTDSLVVTSNHKFLLKRHIKHDPFGGLRSPSDYLSIDEGLSVGHSIQPLLRRTTNGYSYIGTSYKSVQKEPRFLLGYKIGRELGEAEQCHHDDLNKLNDAWDNLDLETVVSHAKIHGLHHNQMFNPEVRARHAAVMQSEKYRTNMSARMKEVLTDPDVRDRHIEAVYASNSARSETVKQLHKTYDYRKKYLMKRFSEEEAERRLTLEFPDNHKIVSIEYLGEEDVYDMEVDTYHNFAANGVFVHNSKEDKTGRPFQGDAGRELNRYLESIGVDRSRVFISNICKCRPLGNRTPTEDEGKFCAGIWLEQELELVKPKVIVAMGVVAAKYFLGDRFTTMEAGHGRPVEMADGRVIFPMYHPAAGLRQKRYMGFVKDDFAALGKLLHGGTVEGEVVDEWAGRENYFTADPRLWLGYTSGYIGIDTESLPDGIPYLVSLSTTSGLGLVVAQAQFENLRTAIDTWVQNTNVQFIFHNLTYDLKVLAKIGITIPISRCHDTMLMAHLLQLESRGLKDLSHRYCGMSMREYSDLVKPGQLPLSVEYLEKVITDGELHWGGWPWPEEELGPQGRKKSLVKRAKAILADTVNKGADPWDRWHNVEEELRHPAEIVLGTMPMAGLDTAPWEDVVWYSGRDPDATLRLFNILHPMIKEQGLEQVYKIDMEALPMIVDMETNGVLVDKDFYKGLKLEHLTEIAEIEGKIYSLAGREFNVGSTDQRAEVLTKLGVKIPKKTKSGKPSTAADVLELVKTSHPIIPFIIERSQIAKLISTYDDGIPIHAGVDNRIRGRIKYTNVLTGRLAMEEPNLMNIPTRTARGRKLRGGVQALDGRVLLSVDLSQIEIRGVAIISGDESLIRGYREDPKFDVHSQTCMDIFNQITEMLRYIAKTCNFGIVYGISASGLTVQIIAEFPESNWTDMQSQNVIDSFFSARPGVKDYIEETKAEARRYGYVTDPFGRRRNIPQIGSSKQSVVEEGLREAVNHKIQSWAQGIIKMGMRKSREAIHEYGLGAKALLQIHDELMFEVPEEELLVTAAVVKEAMESVGRDLDLPIPIAAEAKWGHSWGSMEKLK